MGKGDDVPSVRFHVNGVPHSINNNVGATTALVDYIRDVANLKGTKVMCREGGCGACLVTAKVIDPNTGDEITKSVNSCLTPVLSCDGWDISTVERLGNKQEGYHVLQNRLVNFHGTQCGFCTPGMVMNMYSMLEANKDLEMETIEKNFDGNICRCTGYRPILDAFKSLAKDASDDLQKKWADIEDYAKCPVKNQNGNACCGTSSNAAGGSKAQASSSRHLKLLDSEEEWVTAKTVETALKTAANADSVRFVAGNTSTGIFKNEGPFKTFIDLNGIPELKKITFDDNSITFGGGTTLTELINLLNKSSKNVGFEYGKRVATHLERVANVSVRNNGTIAGNLMIKHKHNNFPSDVFVILEAVGATLTLASLNCMNHVKTLKSVSLFEFLTIDMKLKLIQSVHLPKRDGYHYRGFKITRRYQNAHAYVNAGLLFKVNKANGSFLVEEIPRLVFGGISDSFIHASSAEASLNGKSLTDPATLAAAFQALDGEVKPEMGILESSKEYRVQLVKGLLYKTILEIIGDKAAIKYKSGALDIPRKVTTGKQVLDYDPSATALYKPIPKYEASIQASGEAEYTGDIPIRPDELFGAYVLSTVGNADLIDLDPSEALKIPGVVRFVTAKDIPGVNDNAKCNYFPKALTEPVFATDKIYYHGQSLGMILATSRDAAHKAAKLVKVRYANEQKPVVSIDKAIEKAKADGVYEKQTVGTHKSKPIENIKVAHTLKGNVRVGGQKHFYMETQSIICHPTEDGIDVFISSQCMDHVQNTIASVLGIPSNGVNVQVRRLGGGFGGKASPATKCATACAVSCWVTNRPVRLILDLETNMSMLGGRCPYRIPYEVSFDEDGRIGSLKVDLTCDAGYAANEPTLFVAIMYLQNAYKAAGWEVGTHFVATNTAANTFCRGPGSLKAVATIEWIMDHIANYLKKDPLEVRKVNFLETGDAILYGCSPIYTGYNLIPQIIETMKSDADYDARKEFIETFNKENRWKKRGMAVIPVRYPIEYGVKKYPTSIAIYHMDGHVAVSHGATEMGQGINTKVIQTVAESLNIPLDRVKVKPANNFVAANGSMTSGSVASELVCYSVLKACEEIRENLRPILEKLENPSWEKLIAEAHSAKVKLTASYTPTAKDKVEGYDVWVLNLTEVEIDVLTGEYKIVRTDLYEDTGKSLSPAVDLGQVEGGYIMGQGVWTTEKVVHDENTGKLLTNGTWDYKVPECKDIPEVFNITLLSNNPNPHGVLRSKSTGEPSTDSAYALVLAMRNAIASARKDSGSKDWFEMDAPITPEDIAKLCLLNDSQLKL